MASNSVILIVRIVRSLLQHGYIGFYAEANANFANANLEWVIFESNKKATSRTYNVRNHISMHIFDDFSRGWMRDGAELETVGTGLTTESFIKNNDN